MWYKKLREKFQDNNPGKANLPATTYPLPSRELELAVTETAAKRRDTGIKLRRSHFWKVALFIASLYLFVLAVTLMKDGAGGLSPLMQNFLSIYTVANSLGFGWLFAYLIMSGSPVAASALAFYNTGTINEISAYAMITGSRLGASFIVILIGFIYIMRGRDRATSLSMGLLSLVVTVTTYLPSFFLGIYVLRSGILDGWQIQPGEMILTIFDRIIYPLSDLASNLFPEWIVFLIGLGIIMLSFSLFDKCLPQMSLKESQVGQVSRLVYHPLVMFTLGAGITMISMSVSLSLSILVPLSNRGFIRRENVIPYIMGANITTFIDTLLAAALLDIPSAFTIVLAGMFSITIVSILILITVNRRYQVMSLEFVEWITSSNRNLIIFIIAIFFVPLLLMLV
jgi:sodium-dependent phosphate cotransporter